MCVLYKILILRGAASINFKPRHNNITLIKYCKSLPGECQTECEKDANVKFYRGLQQKHMDIPSVIVVYCLSSYSIYCLLKNGVK